MPTDALRKTLDRLRQVLTANDLTDWELLTRFIADRDETAFTILVRRHAPMVMGVSRRALGNLHDAEDVFQATFLCLAQKARSVINRQALPGWLHTVAYRTALAARARNDRRRRKEQQVEHMPHPEVRTPESEDWQRLLDHELSRLPEKYRLPVILCDLEGRSHKEVQRQLRLAPGTLSSRLTTARRKLAERLTRHGLTLSGGALATMISETTASGCVSPGLVATTVKGAKLAAAGKLDAISSSVTILMKAGANAMFIAKLKATLATMTIFALLGTGGLVFSGGEKPQPNSELDSLRRENELLKVNLRVTLEKIEALEKQVAASNSRYGQTLKFWDTAVGNVGLAFSPDGKVLATVENAGLKFSSDGKVLATGGTGAQLTKPPAQLRKDRALDALEKALKELREAVQQK